MNIVRKGSLTRWPCKGSTLITHVFEACDALAPALDDDCSNDCHATIIV